MTFFWTLFCVAALVALVVLYFFFVGLADGTVSERNFGMWLILLAVTAASLGGGWWLKTLGKISLANTALAVLALPGFLYGLFILAAIILKPRWN